MHYAYPFDMEPQPDGGFTVTQPDVPEAITERDAAEEARERAETVLVTALSFCTDDGKQVPVPTATDGRPIAMVPALVAAKLALHNAMLAAGLSNVELGRCLDWDEKAVRRLRDPLRRSHIGQIAAAQRQLGKRLDARAVEVA